jgi:hypothetical protein
MVKVDNFIASDRECKRCGTPIHTGSYCDDCEMFRQNGLEEMQENLSDR